jgi:hypothetical protein
VHARLFIHRAFIEIGSPLDFETQPMNQRDISMNTRILILATSALLLAAPLSGAQAGRLTDAAKLSLRINAKLAKQMLKSTASITKCALTKGCVSGGKGD